MKRQTRGYMQAFETAASAATLWRALTEPAALRAWLATEAVVEARMGGRYATVSRLFGRREARIERLDPGARLQLLYEPNSDWPPLPDSALVEDFIIDERKGQRMVRVIGEGLPSDEAYAKSLVRLRTGWALAFAQLQLKLKDGTIGEATP
jgi:uncharacterized protein YndB with AHSA1/START domain